jgi:hypothetical protein
MTAGGTLSRDYRRRYKQRSVIKRTEQSYFIRVLSATTFKLVRNYNDINTRKTATFTGTAVLPQILALLTYLTYYLYWVACMEHWTRQIVNKDFKLQIPEHVGYAYAQAQAEKAVNVLNAFPDPKQMDYSRH